MAPITTIWRNQIGRMVGSPGAYTDAQLKTASAIRAIYAMALYTDDDCAALLGNADGECSFIIAARGDRGEAGGISQWHGARQGLIKKNTGIDVWTASAEDQARAVVAEVTQKWSWYHHVDIALRRASGLEAKVAVLVHLYEQSGSPARDIDRRTSMAAYWASQKTALLALSTQPVAFPEASSG